MGPEDGAPPASGVFIPHGSDAGKARLASLPEVFGRCRGIWEWERREDGVRLGAVPWRHADQIHAPDPGWRLKAARVAGGLEVPKKTPGVEPHPCA